MDFAKIQKKGSHATNSGSEKIQYSNRKDKEGTKIQGSINLHSKVRGVSNIAQKKKKG